MRFQMLHSQDWSAAFDLRDMHFRYLSFRTTGHPVFIRLKGVKYKNKVLHFKCS